MLTIAEDDRLMDADEIAQLLGVCERTVRRLMRAGTLPCCPRVSSHQPYRVWRSTLRARLDELQAERLAEAA